MSMRFIFRILLWVFGGLFLLLILLMIGSSQLEQRQDFDAYKLNFKQMNLELSEHSYKINSVKVYYVKLGDPDLPKLMLIHGSPGDWTAWEKLLLETSLAKHYSILLVDRPPYQGTTASGGNLVNQSRMLKKIMEEECQPCTLVGHSYGGGLALQLAVDYPKSVKAVISLAGTVAAEYQPPKWYNRLAQMACVRPFLSSGLSASNFEMISLQGDLNRLKMSLRTLELPFYFLQGGEDVLVDPRSPIALLPYLNHAEIFYNSSYDHFVIWTEMQPVVELINSTNR